MASLSKTTYLMGLQCPKLLWYRYNAKEEIPEADEAQQAIFDQGHEVGALAKKLFPKGIEIAEGIVELSQVVLRTQEALALRRPLFEPACMTPDCYARADILVPVGRNQWDIVEVKSSTKVKDINHHDLAFQKHVFTSAGLKIRKTFLLHINNAYVRQGAVAPKKFFTKADLTEIVAPLALAVPAKVAEMLAVIAQKDCPSVRIGKQCNDPYGCPLIPTCWKFLPERNSVLDLYRVGAHGFKLIHEGITKIADIPESAAHQVVPEEVGISAELSGLRDVRHGDPPVQRQQTLWSGALSIFAPRRGQGRGRARASVVPGCRSRRSTARLHA
jgi:hypothetical protein